MNKRIAYIDCFSGISGDMFLGALFDLGLDLDNELKKIPLKGYSIRAVKEKRKGICGTRFIVDVKGHQKGRTLKDIIELISKSRLSDSVKERSSGLFKLLAQAEAKVHNESINKVHFHEVGAVDSIVDIIGAVIGIERLGLDTIYASSVRLGNNSPPATLELLKGIPVKMVDRDVEMVTPTGAVFLKGLVKKFGNLPQMKLERIGYGIGSRDDGDLANVLRIVLGEKVSGANSIYVIETNIDDMNPQRYGTLMERLFKEGALDVFWTPVQMKKNRPGVLVTVLAPLEKLDALVEILFRETTTFGVRYHQVERRILDREIKKIQGREIKMGSWKGKVYTISPEYADWKGLFKVAP